MLHTGSCTNSFVAISELGLMKSELKGGLAHGIQFSFIPTNPFGN